MSSAFTEKRILGRTGLAVGRLGVGTSYGVDAASLSEAFERGVNYFYWGSRRSEAMAQVIGDVDRAGRRADLVVVLQQYTRSALFLKWSFDRGLRRLGLDRADVLLLGWYGKAPSPRVMDAAMELRERGRVGHIALSGHNRPLFPELAADGRFGLFHVRYNAAHRGAEAEVFARIPPGGRPGLVAFTATRWGDLLNPAKMPEGEPALSASECYRFALSHPSVDVVLCGPKDREQMREALRALELGPLSPQEAERVRRIGDHVHARHRRPFAG